MSRCFFHVVDDFDAPDEEGKEFADAEAAVDWAVESARALMCETLAQQGRITLYHRIDIEDEAGAVVETVAFGDAVRIEADPTGINAAPARPS